jgi:DNA-binding MarR family transcriptional regulator
MLATKQRPEAGAASAEALRVTVQRFIRSFGLLSSDRTACGTPLSTSNAHALMVLLQARGRGERLTQQALGEELGIDKSNVTRLCARMEHAGHVTQERCPNDGRARLLSLTASGARLATKVDGASRERFARLLAALPARSDRTRIVAALDALNAAILASCAEAEAA